MNAFEELKDYIFTLPIIDTHEHLPSTEEVRDRDMDVLKEYIRYWPAYAKVKKILAEGRYGGVRYAEFFRLCARPTWAWNGWISDGKRAGEAALDLHIHDADMAIFLFGMPSRLRSVGTFEKGGGISHISSLYYYKDGPIINSTGGWIYASGFGFNMRTLYLLEGAPIELDYSKNPVLTVIPEGEELYATVLRSQDGYYYELEDFTEGVERGELSGYVTPESAAQAVRLCLEEIRSAEENKKITIDD
jgi:predicted dehydrogenase